MPRRVPSVALLLAFLLSLVISSAAGAADATLPHSMAAVGDSISQAASTGGSLGTDYPQNAWSTGTSTTVNSHYLRLLAARAPISGGGLRVTEPRTCDDGSGTLYMTDDTWSFEGIAGD